jgi:hypothetical protein
MKLVSQLLGLSNEDVKTIGAGATTVGVLLALFGPPLRHWWRSPLLSLDYEAKRGEPHWDHVSLEGQVFFLRVRVRNARGCAAAEDTQVIVASYRAADLGLEGRALEWSAQRSRHEAPVTSLRVPPGLERHVDIVQIDQRPSWAVVAQDDSGNSVGSAVAEHQEARLCVHPKPWGQAHLVPKGDHDVVVTISAANADTVSYRFTISYDGGNSARLLGRPRRVRRRRPATILRYAAKYVLNGFRS